MEFRQLGRSGLKVPVLSLGTLTFGSGDPTHRALGETDAKGARRLVDICIDHDLTLFDTADSYAHGAAETALGEAISGRRSDVLIATKAGFPTGSGPNQSGSSRHHLLDSCEQSLRRLGTDHIDIFFVHRFDPLTPLEETLDVLNSLVTSGKVRYLGCSNLASWQVAKAVATAKHRNQSAYVAYQSYYSLIGRDYETDLMPMTVSEGLGTMVWSPLGWGRLTGKIRKDAEPMTGRIASGGADGGPPVDRERLDRVVDALGKVALETGKTIPQIAINWVLHRPTVTNVIVGARSEQQLRDNLGAVGWNLAPEHRDILEQASATPSPYPHWPQFQAS